MRAHATPWNVAALRILDEQFYDHQEAFAPVIGPRFYANAEAVAQPAGRGAPSPKGGGAIPSRFA